ncbi:hypothetical protein D9M68_892850 [compost metagenome]
MSRYVSGSRRCESDTWVSVNRLLMGVRSSWAMSLEKSINFAKSSSSLSSMVLRLLANSAISTGTASIGIRWSSLWAVTLSARSFMIRSGAKPLRAAHHPSRPLSRVARTT